MRHRSAGSSSEGRAAARLSREGARGGLPRQAAPELVSVHLPKCAGTSFLTVLRRVYGARQVELDRDGIADARSPFHRDFDGWREEARCSVAARRRWPRVLHGHFWLGKYEPRFPDAFRVVWLRDPAVRLVSWYHYWKDQSPGTGNAVHDAIRAGRLSLEEFAELESARDVLTRDFLRGYGLCDFDFVGIAEHFTSDLADLGARLGWPALSAPRERVTTSAGYGRTRSDDALLRRIRELNPEDAELYAQALRQRSRRRAGTGESVARDPARRR